MLDPADVYDRLEMLRGADLSNRVFGASQHRYLLMPPWPERRVATFEQRHAITLPDSYRHFLTKIGAAGAGPGYGLFEPGTWDDDPRSWEGSDRVAPLATPFPHAKAWNLSRERLARLSADPDDDGLGAEYWASTLTAGAMPIASLGGGTQLLLVVSGDQRGKIWVDDRAHDRGLLPEAGLEFADWFQTWLDGAQETVTSRGRRRTTGRRGERPDRTVTLELAAAERLRERVHAALAAGQTVDLGGLGRFCAGPHPHFEQGLGLRDALLVRTPPPGTGDAHDVFAALFEKVATGAAVEVPGLFAAWRAAPATWEFSDYLGRRQVAEEPALLVVVDDPTLPRHPS